MMESEPLNGATHDFEAHRTRVRDAYLNAFSEIVDRTLEEFILPTEREQIIQDVALFVPFLMALKTVEARGLGMERSTLLGAWWPIQKRLKVDVPEMLLNLARAHAAGER